MAAIQRSRPANGNLARSNGFCPARENENGFGLDLTAWVARWKPKPLPAWGGNGGEWDAASSESLNPAGAQPEPERPSEGNKKPRPKAG